MLRAIEIYSLLVLGLLTLFGLKEGEKEGFIVSLFFCPIVVYFIVQLIG